MLLRSCRHFQVFDLSNMALSKTLLMQQMHLCRTATRSYGALNGRAKSTTSLLALAIRGEVAGPATTSIVNTKVNGKKSIRYFSDPSSQLKEDIDSSNPKVQNLYNRVAKLPEQDVNVLGALVLQLLGRTIFPGQFGTEGGGIAAGGEEVAALAEVVEEKTVFDVKLVGFDAKSKIKVIKEVRAIAGLGLKEAKTLVESAPKIIQKDLKRDKADELKEKLELLGAQIEIE